MIGGVYTYERRLLSTASLRSIPNSPSPRALAASPSGSRFDTYTVDRYRMRKAVYREVAPMIEKGRMARSLFRACLPLLLLLVLVAPSIGQTWPQRPVKFIVTLGPGSGVDFGARLLADRLSK